MTIIGRTIKDGDVISIVRKYLVSGIMIDDEYEDSVVGTAQGGNGKLKKGDIVIVQKLSDEKYVIIEKLLEAADEN